MLHIVLRLYSRAQINYRLLSGTLIHNQSISRIYFIVHISNEVADGLQKCFNYLSKKTTTRDYFELSIRYVKCIIISFRIANG